MMILEQFLIGNLWNAGLICVMLGLKCLLRHRLSLRFQYHSWFVLLGSLFLSLLPSGIWSELRPAESVGQQAFAISNASSNTAVTAAGTGWLQDTTELIASPGNNHFAFIVLMIWLAGVLVLTGVYWSGNWRLRTIMQFAAEPSCRIRQRFDACRRRLRLKQKIEQRQSGFITAPVSFGWQRPFVVLPKDSIDRLSQSELDHVLLHELTHIKHGDNITNYLFCVAQALFWCNPLVWLALRQMRWDREAYCDWAVMNEMTSDTERIAYGQTILNFAAASNTRLPTVNGFCQSKDQLKYRLQQVVGFQQETKWKRLLGRCFAGFLAVTAIGQIPTLAYCTEYNETYYKPSGALTMVESDWGEFFGASDGCAVVYDLSADLYTVYNEPEVTHRVPPCSTYKIYSALNALEQGIIAPEANTVAWDGTPYAFESWNQDQTLRSAMQESVNWYFMFLDQSAGTAQMEDFFTEIGYGDCNFGDDSDNYWNGSGVKISALEQVELLVKLYRNDFGFEDENIAAVKDAMSLNEEGLCGKTGTGRLNDTNIAGWFIGFAETRNDTYFIAVYLNSQDGADGALAYDTASNILQTMNIIE